MTSTTRPEWPIITIALRHDADIVLARQRARFIAELLGFGGVDQTRIATATSEVARNAIQHAGTGRAEYLVEGVSPAALVIRVSDPGHGLVRAPAYDSGESVRLGPGSGLVLSKRLMDELIVDTAPGGGTRITLRKHLSPTAPPFGQRQLDALIDELARRPPETLLEEVQQQQQELIAVLDDLVSRQEALKAANRELEDTNRGVLALYGEVTRELEETNRGVLALYAQLDDQTQRLREADALKDRFISHLSHEFRTPLHSMLSLTRLLLDRLDGPLTDEQERQLALVRAAAVDLLEMVDDLLDVAKIQAGKLKVESEPIEVDDLFRDLRGMFRPMAVEAGLELLVEEPVGLPPLVSDRQKVAQILRNLISNALKFTPRGQVRVAATAETPETLQIDVHDTGIGIPPEAQQRIFEDYEQLSGAPGQRARGTGLGLPLSRRLAALLGGTLDLDSRPGEGSTFTLRLPFVAPAPPDEPAPPHEPAPSHAPAPPPRVDPAVERTITAPPERDSSPVALVVEDDPAARYLIDRILWGLGCRVLSVSTGDEGLAMARTRRLDLLILDLALPGLSGYDVLDGLRANPDWREIPVVIVTSARLSSEQIRVLSERSAGVLFKGDPTFAAALEALAERSISSRRAPEPS